MKLSNLKGAAALRRVSKGDVVLRTAVVANAEAHAQDLAQVIADIRPGGATSLNTTAAASNTREMLTRSVGLWQVSNVRNRLRRLELRIEE